MPRPRRYGRMMRVAPFAPGAYSGPASYSRRWCCVSTSSAMPWPTSKAVTSNFPTAGASGTCVSSGVHAARPTQRCGQPRGASIHAVPNRASTRIQGDGAGAVHTASAGADNHPSGHASTTIASCARPSTRSASGDGSTLPASASGVTNRLMTGMATALATGLTSETCPNSSSVSGARPSVTAHCVRAATIRPARQPRVGASGWRLHAYRIAATAPNDSQKPGHSIAHGSRSTDTPSARLSTCDIDAIRPHHSATATTASM